MNASCCARGVLLSGLICFLLPCLPAQQKPAASASPNQNPVSSTPPDDARLVSLPVVVRDKKGALIQSLTKDDFTLQVDGKPQTILSFDKNTSLPLSLGLLVDSSLSQSKLIDEERSAAGSFLDQMLTTAKDKAFVAQFSRQTELLQDLTSSHPLLQAAIKEIDTASSGTASSDSDSAGRRHGGTVLYDALFLTSDEIMQKQTGCKAVVIISDGVDNGSKETIAESIEAAQRADTILYAIYLKGDSHPSNNSNNQPRNRGGFPGGGGYPGGGYPGGGYPGGGYPGGGYPGGGNPGGSNPNGGNGGNNGGNTGGGTTRSNIDGRKVLERMADETGGRLFEVKKNQDFAHIFDQIAEDLRAQYRLRYTPGQDAAGSGYHQIDLTVRDKSLFVQTREGYYGK